VTMATGLPKPIQGTSGSRVSDRSGATVTWSGDRERIAATSISGHCDRPHLIDIVAASSHTKGTHESVCGPPKWKLENGAQRPVPETRPSRPKRQKLPVRDWGAPA
jgi:hypothetical protein